MNKKIITIAEIVFALVFVVLLAVFMATINSKGNTANTQLVDTLDMTDGSSLDRYNGTEVKGTVVTNAISSYKTLNGDIKMQINVITGGKGSTASKTSFYGYSALTTNGNCQAADGKDGSLFESSGISIGNEIGIYNAPKNSDPAYINPSGNFKAELYVNDNGVTCGILFTQIFD